MKPTSKDPSVNEFLQETLGFDRIGSIESNKCVLCKKDAAIFKDDLSVREYTISGLCQLCQDIYF